MLFDKVYFSLIKTLKEIFLPVKVDRYIMKTGIGEKLF